MNKYQFLTVSLAFFIVQISNTSAQEPPSDIKSRLLTEDEGCGIPKTNVSDFKIIGGSTVPQGYYPWMTLLGYVNNYGQKGWKCGGSLISSRHVLTAAHCVTRTLRKVRLGEHNIESDEDGAVQDIDIKQAQKHPDFNKIENINDIAILHLEHDAQFSNRVRPVCLPTNEPLQSRSFVDEKLIIAGWGRLQEGGRLSNVLQQLQLPILKNSECKKQYQRQGRLSSEKQFSELVICGGDLKGGHGSCQGDSGGPLMYPVVNGESYRFYQIGIISYSIGCAKTDTPGVFTSVQNYIDWIQSVINKDDANVHEEQQRIYFTV